MKFLAVSAIVVAIFVARAAARSPGPFGETGIVKRAVDDSSGEGNDKGGSVLPAYDESNDTVLTFIEELGRLASNVPVIGAGLSRLASFAYALLRGIERSTNGALDGVVRNLLPCTFSVADGASCRGTFALDRLPLVLLSNLLKLMTGLSSEVSGANPILDLLVGSITR